MVWALAPALKRYANLKNLCAFMISYQALRISVSHSLGLLLYSTDNADILQATLDCKNTLHMMGVIHNVVKQGSMQNKPILKKYPTKEDLLKFAILIRYTGKIDKLEISVVLKLINSFSIITGNENMALRIWDLFRSTVSLRRSVSVWSDFMCQFTMNVDVDGYNKLNFSHSLIWIQIICL